MLQRDTLAYHPSAPGTTQKLSERLRQFMARTISKMATSSPRSGLWRSPLAFPETASVRPSMPLPSGGSLRAVMATARMSEYRTWNLSGAPFLRRWIRKDTCSTKSWCPRMTKRLPTYRALMERVCRLCEALLRATTMRQLRMRCLKCSASTRDVEGFSTRYAACTLAAPL